jgi:hypothetical protein
VSSRSNLTCSPSIGRPLHDAGSDLPDGSPARCFRGGFTGSSSESSGLGPPGLWVVRIAPGREREQRRIRLGSRCGGLGPGQVFATASGGDGMPGVVFRPLEYSMRHYSMRNRRRGAGYCSPRARDKRRCGAEATSAGAGSEIGRCSRTGRRGDAPGVWIPRSGSRSICEAGRGVREA